LPVAELGLAQSTEHGPGAPLNGAFVKLTIDGRFADFGANPYPHKTIMLRADEVVGIRVIEGSDANFKSMQVRPCAQDAAPTQVAKADAPQIIVNVPAPQITVNVPEPVVNLLLQPKPAERKSVAFSRDTQGNIQSAE